MILFIYGLYNVGDLIIKQCIYYFICVLFRLSCRCAKCYIYLQCTIQSGNGQNRNDESAESHNKLDETLSVRNNKRVAVKGTTLTRETAVKKTTSKMAVKNTTSKMAVKKTTSKTAVKKTTSKTAVKKTTSKMAIRTQQRLYHIITVNSDKIQFN